MFPIEIIEEIAFKNIRAFHKLAISVPKLGRLTLSKSYQNRIHQHFIKIVINNYTTEHRLKCNDKLHSIYDKPAVIWPSGSKGWYQNGKRHRDNDKPAVIWSNGIKAWVKNGELHRNDNPAVIHPSGYKIWYQNGKKHRDNDKPAVICFNGYKAWYQNGERIFFTTISKNNI